MKTLLTGFNPFSGVEVNPSQVVVEEISRRVKSSNWFDIFIEVLPTEFAVAGERIRQLIHEIRPEVIIGLGLAIGANSILLERIALNVDDAIAEDNAGLKVNGSPIEPDGPVAYRSTLPLERMLQALQTRGIPAYISNHAGTYVCNHVFYAMLYEIEQMRANTLCGFIHLPMLSDQVGVSSGQFPGLSLALMLEAIECCLKVIQTKR